MIRFAALDGVGAVDLLEEDHEGEFVLEGERREGEKGIGVLPKLLAVAIWAADEEGHGLYLSSLFQGVDAIDEFVGGEEIAALVHRDPISASAPLEELPRFVLILEVLDLDLAGSLEAFLELGNTIGSIAELRFANG